MRGAVIGDFRLIEKIAQGGMGQVWEALQMSLRRPVAIKFIRQDRVDDQAIAFFAREARAGGRLNHPGVVTVHATGETQGLHWIAQELVPGGATMRNFIEDLRKSTGIPSDYYRRLARFLAELTDAMQVAHEAGVIHRDLKPSNILITPDDHPKVTDFGLARLVDEASLSGPIALEGTPHYMSPEQVAAKALGIDHRTDIFSLGALFYEALTLRRPFSAQNQAELYQLILREDPPDPRSISARIPADLAVVCMKALEKRREDRFSSMRDLGDELRRFLDDEPVLARSPGPWRRAGKWMRRRPAASIALGLGLALLGSGGWAARRIQSIGQQALQQRKENLVIQAEYAIENAHLEEAERLMTAYGQLDSNDYLPHLVLARGYSQYLRAAEAEEHFELARGMGFESTAPDPRDPEALYQHALALVIERDPSKLDEAIRCLSDAILLNRRFRAAYFPLYQLHKERGDLVAAEQALAAFRGILATGDDYFDVVEAMRAELQGRFSDAVQVLLDVEQRVGTERAAELRLDRILGRLYLQMALNPGRAEADSPRADLDAARARLEAAVTAIPSDAGSWVNLGMSEIRRYWLDPAAPQALECLDRALRHGRRAVDEYPRFAPGLRIVLNALVFEATRHFDPRTADLDLLRQAEAVATELRELDPTHPSLDLMEGQIAFHLGMLAELEGDDAGAEELYARSLDRDPNQVLPRLWLAQSDYARGDFDASFAQLRTARHVLDQFAGEDAIRKLPPVFLAKLHIWTFGAAGHLGTAEAIEVAWNARRDIEAALEADQEIEPLELLNYAEFLATSPSPELRDCDEAQWILEQFGLAGRFRGTPHEESVRGVETAVQGCR